MDSARIPIGPLESAKRMADVTTTVTGFLQSFASKQLPNGRHMHAFSDRASFDKIETGYACGECLATFNTYTQVCPVCHIDRADAAREQPTPEDWQAFYNEHILGSGKTQTRGPEEFLHDLMGDRDVEHAQLSRLRPGSAGRRARRG